MSSMRVDATLESAEQVKMFVLDVVHQITLFGIVLKQLREKLYPVRDQEMFLPEVDHRETQELERITGVCPETQQLDQMLEHP